MLFLLHRHLTMELNAHGIVGFYDVVESFEKVFVFEGRHQWNQLFQSLSNVMFHVRKLF